MVGPVSVPASVDQPEFVVQVAPNRVEVDEFNRWATPLNDAIAQVVAGDLVKLDPMQKRQILCPFLSELNHRFRKSMRNGCPHESRRNLI
jgi:uncharacterized lipoprotein YmbA